LRSRGDQWNGLPRDREPEYCYQQYCVRDPDKRKLFDYKEGYIIVYGSPVWTGTEWSDLRDRLDKSIGTKLIVPKWNKPLQISINNASRGGHFHMHGGPGTYIIEDIYVLTNASGQDCWNATVDSKRQGAIERRKNRIRQAKLDQITLHDSLDLSNRLLSITKTVFESLNNAFGFTERRERISDDWRNLSYDVSTLFGDDYLDSYLNSYIVLKRIVRPRQWSAAMKTSKPAAKIEWDALQEVRTGKSKLSLKVITEGQFDFLSFEDMMVQLWGFRRKKTAEDLKKALDEPLKKLIKTPEKDGK